MTSPNDAYGDVVCNAADHVGIPRETIDRFLATLQMCGWHLAPVSTTAHGGTAQVSTPHGWPDGGLRSKESEQRCRWPACENDLTQCPNDCDRNTGEFRPPRSSEKLEEGELEWLHRFLNASVFGPPPSEIQRAHAVVDKLAASQSARADRTYLDFCLRLNAARIGMNNGAICKVLDEIDAHFHNMAGGH